MPVGVQRSPFGRLAVMGQKRVDHVPRPDVDDHAFGHCSGQGKKSENNRIRPGEGMKV